MASGAGEVGQNQKASDWHWGWPTYDVVLTPEEERIARCLHREQVEGIEGFDSREDVLRTGKCVLYFLSGV